MINMNGTWVGVNPAVPRKVLEEGIRSGAVPSFTGYNEILRDATYGPRGKVDFMLLGMEQNCFINIHGVTWSEDGVALFPDTASERPKRSLRELAEVAKQGHRAVAFFLVLRGDCETFRPAERVDREYLRTILDAHSAGVELIVYRADIKLDEISLGVPIPYSLV
jgi:sugar fermentation stimulation protein A